MSKVYVQIRHWLFWYGHYGFCDKSCNDEIVIYSDKKEQHRLGYFEITTERALKYCLENDINETTDKEYYDEVKNFLYSSDGIHFYFIYPREVCYDDDLLHQVTHDAPKDGNGNKPVYIDMWTKKYECWDIDTIKGCVELLDSEFLHKGIIDIEILHIPTYEETKASYEKDVSLGL